MFNDVMFLGIIVAAGILMLLYPLGVALATARAAERVVKARGGGRIDHVMSSRAIRHMATCSRASSA